MRKWQVCLRCVYIFIYNSSCHVRTPKCNCGTYHAFSRMYIYSDWDCFCHNVVGSSHFFKCPTLFLWCAAVWLNLTGLPAFWYSLWRESSSNLCHASYSPVPFLAPCLVLLQFFPPCLAFESDPAVWTPSLHPQQTLWRSCWRISWIFSHPLTKAIVSEFNCFIVYDHNEIHVCC